MKKQDAAVASIALPAGVNHVLVALSGGADSVYLLHALKQSGAEVSAAHFHHGLRASADEDMRFCRELCEALDVPLYEGGADVAFYAKQHGMGVETAAREMRYRFLRNIRKACGAEVIALGHHMNDQAETVLMHLMRGSSLKGVSGMAELDGELYRPLLHISKRQITDSLRAVGVEWREDETNAVSDNPRNALRNEILPQIRQIYPGADQALSRFAQIAREDWQLLENQTTELLNRRAWRLPNGWRVDGVKEIPEPMLRRILMRLTGVQDMRQLKTMAQNAKTTRKRIEFTHFRLEPHGENLYIIDTAFSAPQPVDFACDGESVLSGLCRMYSEPWMPEPELSGGMVQVLACLPLQGAKLRTRQTGDWIHPLGAPGAKSLSDYLIDKKIPRPRRDVLPVLARGNEILWVVGVGISEAVRVKSDSLAVRIWCDMAEFPV